MLLAIWFWFLFIVFCGFICVYYTFANAPSFLCPHFSIFWYCTNIPRQCNLISFDGTTDAGNYSPEFLTLKACFNLWSCYQTLLGLKSVQVWATVHCRWLLALFWWFLNGYVLLETERGKQSPWRRLKRQSQVFLKQILRCLFGT